jgi:restriction endonuclease S subunit
MSEFDRKPLCELADCRMGETILSKDLDGTGYPIFSADSSAGAWGHKKQISKILKRGSIVIGARGTIGNPRLPDHDEFGCTQTTIAVTPSNEVDPYYLKLALESSDIKSISAQQAVPMLTIEQIAQLEIAVPPLPEQKKIAEILSGIDNTSARLSKKLHKIVNLKESVETTLFKRHPNETSGECRWVRLEDIATFSQGVQVGVENHFSRKDGGQVRFVRISDYTRTREEPRFIDQKYAVKGLVARDDVVMIRYGEAGRVCRGIEGAIANNLFTITPNKGISKDYLYCYLACNQVQKNIAKISASSAMPAINFLQLGGIEFKLVDECSQAKSVSQINSLENKINLLVSQINRLSDLSLAVGSDLLSGRKRVSV